MSRQTTTLGIAITVAALAAMPLGAQAGATPQDPGIMAARMAAQTVPAWLAKAAEQMSDEDYAFRPTPEVRTFGQLIAHVADQDYEFCAAASGEQQPVRDVEKTKTTRADIKAALADAQAYCNGVYARLTEASGKVMVPLRGRQMPALAVLLFKTHHNSLHYGNVVTYMRLRGKVPPSSER
jgi:uncharacterized damage-inducible protein DinB